MRNRDDEMIKCDIETNDVVKFLATIDNISSHVSMLDTKDKPRFLFRGESAQHNKVLLPKYLRPLNEENVKSKSCYLKDELDIVTQFRDEALIHLPNIPKNDIQIWREYAQHYGVPTKLLDFTSNPLTAMYFACKGNDEEKGIVWMINWQNYHQNTNSEDIHGNNLRESKLSVSEIVDKAAQGNLILRNPVIYSPCYIDQRMSAQGSYFMLWGEDDADLISQIGSEKVIEAKYKHEDKGRCAQYNDPTILYYFRIDKEQKKRNLLRLSRMGINEKTLFPGLDGVGKYIDAINRYSGQEHIDRLFGSL